MMRAFKWLWKHGVLNNFLAGAFVVLPVAVTIGVISWIAGKLGDFAKPVSDFLVKSVEGILPAIDYKLDTTIVALIVGWSVVLILIWGIGIMVKLFATHRIEDTFHNLLNHIPLFNAIYKPISQVVGLLKKDDNNDMNGMSVVMCTFGAALGGRFLALQASTEIYQFEGQDSLLVYIPTSPVPMSGGLIFIPMSSVTKVEMSVDDLMKIYFSLGVLSPQVIPEKYKAPNLDAAKDSTPQK